MAFDPNAPVDPNLPVVRMPDGTRVTRENGVWRPMSDSEKWSALVVPPKHRDAAKILAEGPDIVDERGVTRGERAIIKNLTNNWRAQKDTLEDWGYSVMAAPKRYAGILRSNWLVRRSDKDPWRPVDMNRLTGGEFIDDLLDLSSDAASGLLTTIGALGGPYGAAAGAGIAELGRQALGKKLGVKQDIDPLMLLVAGGSGAVGEVAGPLANKVVAATAQGVSRATGWVGREVLAPMAAQVAGIAGPHKGATLVERALIKASLMKPQHRYGAMFYAQMQRVADDMIPELKQAGELMKTADDMIAQAGSPGVNIRDVLDELVELTPKAVRTAPAATTTTKRVLTETEARATREGVRKSDVTSEGVVRNLLDEVDTPFHRQTVSQTDATVGTAGKSMRETTTRRTAQSLDEVETFAPRSVKQATMAAKEAPFTSTMLELKASIDKILLAASEEYGRPITADDMPIAVADAVRKVFQARADFTGEVGLKQVQAFSNHAYRQIRHILAKRMDEVMPESGFRTLMKRGGDRLDIVRSIRSQLAGATTNERIRNATEYLARTTGASYGGYIQAIKDLDSWAGTKLTHLIDRAAIARYVDPKGQQGRLVAHPRLTATGSFISSAMAGGLGVGAAGLGVGPLGAIGIGIGAFAAASPRGVTALTRSALRQQGRLTRLGQGGIRPGAKVSFLGSSVAHGTTQGALRSVDDDRPVLDEDRPAPPPRRSVLR